MKVGDAWGRLKVVEIVQRVIERDTGDGGFEQYTASVAVLECDCGERVDCEVKLFPGKRRVRDCGCGLSERDGMQVGFSATLPVGLIEEVRELARREGAGSFSQVLAVVVRKGLESLKSN